MRRHTQTLTDAYMLSKWRTCKLSLQAEHILVQSIQKDKSAFAQPVDVAASAAIRCSQVASSALEIIIAALSTPILIRCRIRMKLLIAWSDMLHAAIIYRMAGLPILYRNATSSLATAQRTPAQPLYPNLAYMWYVSHSSRIQSCDSSARSLTQML